MSTLVRDYNAWVVSQFEISAALAQRWKPARHPKNAALTGLEGGPPELCNSIPTTVRVYAFFADDRWKCDFGPPARDQGVRGVCRICRPAARESGLRFRHDEANS